MFPPLKETNNIMAQNSTQKEFENVLNEIEAQNFHLGNTKNDEFIYDKINTFLQSRLNLPLNEKELLAKKIFRKIKRAQANRSDFSKASLFQSHIPNHNKTPIEKEIKSKNQKILNKKTNDLDKISQASQDIRNNKNDVNKLKNKSLEIIYLDDNRFQNKSSAPMKSLKNHDYKKNKKYYNKEDSNNNKNYNDFTSLPHNVTNSVINTKEGPETLFHTKENYGIQGRTNHEHDKVTPGKGGQSKSVGGEIRENYEPNRKQVNVSLSIQHLPSFDNIITSTPRASTDDKQLKDAEFTKVTLDVDSTVIDKNQLHLKIKEWLDLLKLKLNKDDEEKIITSIASDIILRDNYMRKSLKMVSDLEDIEYLKYLIFKVINDHIESQKMNDVLSRVSKLHETLEKTIISINNETIKENNTFHDVITSFLNWIVALNEIKSQNLTDSKKITNYESTKQELIKKIDNFNIYSKWNGVQESLKNEIKIILRRYLNNIDIKMSGNKDNAIQSVNDLESSLFTDTQRFSNNISEFVEELIKLVLRYACLSNKNLIQHNIERDVLQLLKVLSTVLKFGANTLDNKKLPQLSTMIKTAIEKYLDPMINAKQPEIERSDSLLYKILYMWCKHLPTYVKFIETDNDDYTNLLSYKLFEKIKLLNQNHNLFDSNGFNDDALSNEVNLILNELPITQENIEDLFHYKQILISQLKDNIQDIQDELQIGAYRQNLINSLSKNLPNSETFSKDDLISFEILKNNLAKAFINLKCYSVDEDMKKKHEKKLINEINKFCDLYLKRFPDSPLETKQLQSNIYNALENVSKPIKSKLEEEIKSKLEEEIIMEINNWLDEIRKEKNNFTTLEEDNAIPLLADRLLILSKEHKLSTLTKNEELGKTILQLLKNYNLNQNKPLDRYWVEKLINKLKTLQLFGTPQLSATTVVSMHTIPAAETTMENQVKKGNSRPMHNQKEPPNQTNHINIDASPVLASDILTAEDRDHLTRIIDRSSVPQTSKNIEPEYSSKPTKHKTFSSRNQTIVDESGLRQEVSPDIFVREYFWDSNESNESSQISMPKKLLEDTNFENMEKRKSRSLVKQTPKAIESTKVSNDPSSTFADGNLQYIRNTPVANNDILFDSSQKVLPRNLNKTAPEQIVTIREHFKSLDNCNCSTGITNEKGTKAKVKDSVLAVDILSPEDKDHLARIRKRSSVPQPFKNIEPEYASTDTQHKTIRVQNETKVDKTGPGQQISPNISIREYFWDSNESNQSSQIIVPKKLLDNKKISSKSFVANTPKTIEPYKYSNNEASEVAGENLQYIRNKPFVDNDMLTDSSKKLLPRTSNKIASEQTATIQEHLKSLHNTRTMNGRNTVAKDKVKAVKIIDTDRETQSKTLEPKENIIATKSYEQVSEGANKTYKDRGRWNDCVTDLMKNSCTKCRRRRLRRFTLESESLHQTEEYKFCSCRNDMLEKRKIDYFVMKKPYPELPNCAQCFGASCPFPCCIYFENDFRNSIY